MKAPLALAVIVALTAIGVADDKLSGTPKPIKPVRQDAPYQAYWLTAQGDKGEYNRLLITHGPVEELAGHKAWSALPLDNMAMTFRTYRRDSLWNDPFRCVQQFGAVDAAAKTAVVDGAAYLYKPCPLADVVRLLERPLGTVPIHRREDPLSGAGQTAKAFRLLLREQMKAEK